MFDLKINELSIFSPLPYDKIGSNFLGIMDEEVNGVYLSRA